MKKYSFLFFAILTLVIVSCNNAQKTNDKVMTKTIEVVAPKAMYEILLKDPSAQLVDVRTKDEFAVSHLKDAQNICVTDNDFKQKVAFLDRSKPVYVYCKKGGRSAQASKILKQMGFTKIFDLQGGITNWEQQQLSTQK
jgi:rhodanese-related sulfurtransferase